MFPRVYLASSTARPYRQTAKQIRETWFATRGSLVILLKCSCSPLLSSVTSVGKIRRAPVPSRSLHKCTRDYERWCKTVHRNRFGLDTHCIRDTFKCNGIWGFLCFFSQCMVWFSLGGKLNVFRLGQEDMYNNCLMLHLEKLVLLL